MNMNEWIVPLSILAGGIIISILVEHVIIRRIKKATCKTNQNTLCIVSMSMKGFIAFWIFLGTVFAAYEFIAEMFEPSVNHIIIKTIISITIISIALFIANIASSFIRAYGKNASGDLPTTSLVSNIVRIFVYIGGCTILLQYLGVSITPLITALGVGGLAVALALQDTLSNLFAGIHILAAHNIHSNDYVKLSSGEEGYITDITWRNTVIRTMSDTIVIVPNTQIAATILTNFSYPSRKLYVGIPFSINPEADLEFAEKILIEETIHAMENVGGTVHGYAPIIRFQQWTESRVEGTIWVYVEQFDKQFPLRHECIKRFITRFKQEGLPLPYAVRTIVTRTDTPNLSKKETL